MTQDELKEYKKKISNLTVNEKKMRDLHLRDLSLGLVEGPLTGFPSIDKPWLKFYPEEAINNAYEYSLEYPIYQMIDNKAKEYKDEPALRYFNSCISYTDFVNKSCEIAKGLKALGIKEGDIVTVCLPCIPEFAYFFYAINRIGAISNWVDFRASNNEITHILNEVNSNVVISFDGVDEKIIQSIKEHNSGSQKIDTLVRVKPYDSIPQPVKAFLKVKDLFGKKANLDGVSEISMDTLKKIGANQPLSSVDFKKDNTIAIVYTGGTTGISKGVELTNENINALANNYHNSSIDLKQGDSFLHFLPPWTAYGIGIFYYAITTGINTILIPKLDPATYDKLIKKEKPNSTTGIPKNLEILVNSKAFKDNDDLSFFKYVGVGADYLNENLEQQTLDFLERHNSKAKVSKGYGMTETCATFTTTSNTINKLKSVGIPFAANNIYIEKIGEPGHELQYGELGEICLSGPSVMKGYLFNSNATSDVLKESLDGNKWMHTGDIGKIDEDGFLYITGRLKRMLVRSGFKLFPSEIEDAVSSHHQVVNCAAVGVEDRLEGTIPVVSIVLNTDNYIPEKLEKEIDDICSKHLYDYYMPLIYRVVDELPYTKNGKVDYRKLESDSKEYVKTLNQGKALTKK